MDVNKCFIRQKEGFKTDGYVPNKNGIAIDDSGVTIGMGVDLGQMDKKELNGLPISDDLKHKLSAYISFKRQDALNAINNNPLSITSEEAVSLSMSVMDKITQKVADKYNKAKPPNTFEQLPGDIQTAILDLAYQHGPELPTKTPKFWGYITKGDWNGAVKELNDFGDEHASRRKEEAKLIKRALDDGWPDNYEPEKVECDVLLLDHRLVKDDEGSIYSRVRVEGNVLVLKPRSKIFVRLTFYGKDGSEKPSLDIGYGEYKSSEIYHFICSCLCVTSAEVANIVRYRIEEVSSY